MPAADAVVVATEWPEFARRSTGPPSRPTMAGEVIIDGRRIVDVEAASAAGLRVVALGVEVSGRRPPAGRLTDAQRLRRDEASGRDAGRASVCRGADALRPDGC